MLKGEDKIMVQQRLKKIEGQVRGVQKMLEEERYCMDILAQTGAVTAAIRKVEQIILQQHLHSCVTESMRSRDEKDKDQKIREIMDLIGKIKRS